MGDENDINHDSRVSRNARFAFHVYFFVAALTMKLLIIND